MAPGPKFLGTDAGSPPVAAKYVDSSQEGVDAYFAKNEARIKPSSRKTAAEAKANRVASMVKARAAKDLKFAARELVRQKVAKALPISQEERSLLLWKGGNKHGQTEEALAIAASAKLVMKPQSVNELRMLVESTAAKHHYNPIEKLIEIAASGSVDEKDKIAIHKALLPFLVPQLATPKPSNDSGSEGGIKVVIASFTFDASKPQKAIHTEKLTTVETSAQ